MHTSDCFLQMNHGKAMSVFKQLGVDVTGMSPAEIRTARNRLLEVCHPDRGGPVELAQKVNAAYALLKNGTQCAGKCEEGSCDLPDVAGGKGHGKASDALWEDEKLWPAEPASPPKSGSKKPKPRIPEWARAGYSGGPSPDTQIHRNSFTDQNFFKKSMWELSGKSKQEYRVWAYDGSSFSSWITVYGSRAIFDYMASAMVEWQKTKGACRAVFASEAGSRALNLIYADGRYFGEKPLRISHNAFNENPQNDELFTRVTLPIFLDRIESEEREEAATA